MAVRWAPLGTIVTLVALVQLAPARASEPDLALAAWGAGTSAEFQAVVGDRVFFSAGSAELGSRGRRALQAQAAWLARHPVVRVTVEGHADDPGGGDDQLSALRAATVRQGLVDAGVSPERIRTVAYGRRHLIAACSDPLCGPQNRRAVTVVGWPTAAAEPYALRRTGRGSVSRPSAGRFY